MIALLLTVACAPDPTSPDDSSAPASTEPTVTETGVEAEPLQLCLNELVAENASGWEVDGAHPDWIELHNPTAAPVSLDGWFLTDDPEDPFRAPLDRSAVVDPGGFYVVAADTVALPFALDALGESVGLFRRDGAGEVLSFGAVAEDFAWARVPDCCPDPAGCAAQVWLGTPGASNAPARRSR